MQTVQMIQGKEDRGREAQSAQSAHEHGICFFLWYWCVLNHPGAACSHKSVARLALLVREADLAAPHAVLALLASLCVALAALGLQGGGRGGAVGTEGRHHPTARRPFKPCARSHLAPVLGSALGIVQGPLLLERRHQGAPLRGACLLGGTQLGAVDIAQLTLPQLRLCKLVCGAPGRERSAGEGKGSRSEIEVPARTFGVARLNFGVGENCLDL
jgi:hypothetical protein